LQIKWDYRKKGVHNRFCDPVCCYIVAFGVEKVKREIIYVKFYFKVRKTAAETHKIMCEDYRHDALHK
jgi:hypothetical protein